MRNRLFWMLLLLAIGVGAGSTWVDTRPGWDDTGITAGLIFISTAMLSFLLPSGAWAFALAVSAWIPAMGVVHGHHATLLALLVGAAGAGAGAVTRRILASMTP